MSRDGAPRRHGGGWIGLGLWLVLLAALGGVGWAGLSACGLGVMGGFLSFCPAAADPPDMSATRLLTEEAARTRLLETDLNRLRLALLDQEACPEPPVLVAEVPPPPEPEVVPEPEPEPIEVAEVPPEPDPPPTAPVPGHRPTPPPLPEPPPQVAELPPQPEPQPQPRVPDEFDQRVARDGGQQGEVQVTLLWDNTNDLDVHVFCPTGQQIWYGGMYGCGGSLDIDANAGWGNNPSPVENVTWPGGAPPGMYRVEINHFANHGGRDPTPYRVRIRVGNNEQIYTGIISPGQPRRVLTFQVP
ncbi:MAG: hypothetical protein KDA64_08515 [Rhodospirillaceae bacterium]|nr:hypothetical protein [Rhodospirillaceae bacterium]